MWWDHLLLVTKYERPKKYQHNVSLIGLIKEAELKLRGKNMQQITSTEVNQDSIIMVQKDDNGTGFIRQWV